VTLFELTWGLLFAMFVAFFIWQLLHRSEALAYTTDETIGTVQPFDVGIAHDGRRRLVELTVHHESSEGKVMELHTFLTPSQARLMAQWLRLAATSGRTLADARRRSSKVPT
jgi:hypothetical protein